MDPLVTAAIVGVSGTVVVGVAGFGASIWNTSKSIAHARENRLWDKRAAVYVEALAAVHSRQIGRMVLISSLDPQNTLKVPTDVARYETPDWVGLEARMQAFASEPVFTAMQASSSAALEFDRAASSWRQSLGRSVPPVPMDTGDILGATVLHEAVTATNQARETTEKARKVAEDADDKLIERMRTALQGRGKPVGDWQPT